MNTAVPNKTATNFQVLLVNEKAFVIQQGTEAYRVLFSLGLSKDDILNSGPLTYDAAINWVNGYDFRGIRDRDEAKRSRLRAQGKPTVKHC